MEKSLYQVGRSIGLFHKLPIKLSRKARKKIRAYLAADDNLQVCNVIMGPMWQLTGVVTPTEYTVAEQMSYIHLQQKLQALMALAKIMGSEMGAEMAIDQVLEERATRRYIEVVPANLIGDVEPVLV